MALTGMYANQLTLNFAKTIHRFIGHKGPAPDFGRFPPAGATRFPIEFDAIHENEIISFDGKVMVGDKLVPKSNSVRAPRERIEGSRQTTIYRTTVENRRFTTLAVKKTSGRKRARFALGGPDGSSSDSSSDPSGPSNAPRASKKKRQKYIAESISKASSMFLNAFSMSIYETAKQAAFTAEQRLKRKAEDALEPPSSKRPRILLFPGKEIFQVLGDRAELAKAITTALHPFFEAFSRSIYETARKAAFDAEIKKRKAKDELDEPSSKRSRPDNSEEGEQERFAALRTVVGTKLARAIQSFINGMIRKRTHSFCRRHKIPWTPPPIKLDGDDDDDHDEDDEDDHGGSEDIGGPGHGPDNDGDKDEDEADDDYVITTDHLTPDGKGGHKKRGNENTCDGKYGVKGGETETETNQDDGKKSTDRSEQGEERRDRGGGSEEERDDNSNGSHGSTESRGNDNSDKRGSDGGQDSEDDKRPKDKDDEESNSESPRDDDDNGQDDDDNNDGPQQSSDAMGPYWKDSGAPHVEPKTRLHNSADAIEPDSPIDQATLDRIAAEQRELEIQRTMERNIAEANDPVARERVRREEEARRAAEQAQIEEIKQSLMEDSDDELSGFDDSDGEDEEDEEAVTDEESKESADEESTNVDKDLSSDDEEGAGEGNGESDGDLGGQEEDNKQEDEGEEAGSHDSTRETTNMVEEKSNDGSGATPHNQQTTEGSAFYDQDTATEPPAPTGSPKLKRRPVRRRQAARSTINNRTTTQATTMSSSGQSGGDGNNGSNGEDPPHDGRKMSKEEADAYMTKRIADMARSLTTATAAQNRAWNKSEMDRDISSGDGTSDSGGDGTTDSGTSIFLSHSTRHRPR